MIKRPEVQANPKVASSGNQNEQLDYKLKYQSLEKKHKFLKKEYMKILKQWEDSRQKYSIIARERKFLRAKINMMIKTAKVSQQVATVLYPTTDAHNLDNKNLDSDAEEEEEVQSESQIVEAAEEIYDSGEDERNNNKEESSSANK